jgi:hypothetical protein
LVIPPLALLRPLPVARADFDSRRFWPLSSRSPSHPARARGWLPFWDFEAASLVWNVFAMVLPFIVKIRGSREHSVNPRPAVDNFCPRYLYDPGKRAFSCIKIVRWDIFLRTCSTSHGDCDTVGWVQPTSPTRFTVGCTHPTDGRWPSRRNGPAWRGIGRSTRSDYMRGIHRRQRRAGLLDVGFRRLALDRLCFHRPAPTPPA